MPKKKGKKNTKNKDEVVKKELIIKGDLEEYGKVEKMLGNRRLSISLVDGSKKLCIIPGRFKRGKGGMWINVGDIILVSTREYQQARSDMIHKYNQQEVTKLLKAGYIPPSFMQYSTEENNTGGTDVGDIFSFEDCNEIEEDLEFDDI